MSIFKAYDIRGLYGSELTEEIAYKIGRAFVSFLKCKKIVVGRDMRESSPLIEEQLVKGLTDQGADVVQIGLSTTPMLYFATAELGLDAGINVTASHNPAEYNGFKLVRKNAVPISGATGIKQIEKLVIKAKFKDPRKKGETSVKDDLVSSYVNNALKRVELAKTRKYKLVIDTANGMGGIVIPDLLFQVNCDFEHMFADLDGRFPNHEANPLNHETLHWLQERVKNNKADFGVAFDGDADRIAFVDENGNIVPSDLITALIAMEILEQKSGSKILYDLRSSRVVGETILASGGKPAETRVGHSFIKEHMRKVKAEFAGEVSGHYYLKDNYYIESPFIIMLMLMKLIEDKGSTLSELIAPLQVYYSTGEINFEVKDKQGAMKRIKTTFSKAKKIYSLDGLSIVFDDWWMNLRPSNTEPFLRLNLEAPTPEKRDEMKEKISRILADY